jgi:hypothetical protein
MANYPDTLSWYNKGWKAQEPLAETVYESTEINVLDFTLRKAGSNYNSYGNMSTAKQISEDPATKIKSTTYWWGYNTQVNFSVPLAKGETVQ